MHKPSHQWSQDKEIDLLKQHLIAVEDVEEESKLSSKAKQVLVIKKVNYDLMQKVRVLKKGSLLKLSKKPKSTAKE